MILFIVATYMLIIKAMSTVAANKVHFEPVM